MKEYSIAKILIFIGFICLTGLTCFFGYNYFKTSNDFKAVVSSKDKTIKELKEQVKALNDGLSSFTSINDAEMTQVTNLLNTYYHTRYDYTDKNYLEIPTKLQDKLSAEQMKQLEKEVSLMQAPEGTTQSSIQSRFSDDDFQFFVNKKNGTEIHIISFIKMFQVIDEMEYPYEVVQLLELTPDMKQIKNIKNLPVKSEIDRSYD